MDVHVSQPSRPARLRYVAGFFLMSIFATAWGLAGTFFLSGIVRLVAIVLVCLITLALLGRGAQLLSSARRLPNTLTLQEGVRQKSVGRWFGLIFGLEGLLIALAVLLLGRLRVPQFITPAIALIVGLHFLPLARLFNVRVYYLTGTLLSVLALLAIIALLFAGSAPTNWALFVCMGSALLLWLTLLYTSNAAMQQMKQEA